MNVLNEARHFLGCQCFQKLNTVEDVLEYELGTPSALVLSCQHKTGAQHDCVNVTQETQLDQHPRVFELQNEFDCERMLACDTHTHAT